MFQQGKTVGRGTLKLESRADASKVLHIFSIRLLIKKLSSLGDFVLT